MPADDTNKAAAEIEDVDLLTDDDTNEAAAEIKDSESLADDTNKAAAEVTDGELIRSHLAPQGDGDMAWMNEWAMECRVSDLSNRPHLVYSRLRMHRVTCA